MKYRILTDKTKTINGRHTLHRIQRISDNKLGGWIEKEHNLSQEGTCWVGDEACVFENAIVSDSAQVYDSAWVRGSARVYEKADVFGSARVWGSARVFGKAQVYGLSEVYGSAWVYDSAKVFSGAMVYGRVQVFGCAEIKKTINGNELYDSIHVNSIEKPNEILATKFSVKGNKIKITLDDGSVMRYTLR